MNIEELAFKDRKNLAQLTELDLLDIIEFLQFDRKQWINQFSKTHNESIDIQKENKQLKSILTDLEKWCNDGIKDELVKFDYGTEIIGTPIKIHITSYEMILDKMQELEQGSDKVGSDE